MVTVYRLASASSNSFCVDPGTTGDPVVVGLSLIHI